MSQLISTSALHSSNGVSHTHASLASFNSILSIPSYASILSPAVLKQLKKNFLRGQSTASQYGENKQKQELYEDAKKIVDGGESEVVSHSSKRARDDENEPPNSSSSSSSAIRFVGGFKRRKKKSSHSYTTALHVDHDDHELAALALARELVEFSFKFSILDDGGVTDDVIHQDEKDYQELISAQDESPASASPHSSIARHSSDDLPALARVNSQDSYGDEDDDEDSPVSSSSSAIDVEYGSLPSLPSATDAHVTTFPIPLSSSTSFSQSFTQTHTYDSGMKFDENTSSALFSSFPSFSSSMTSDMTSFLFPSSLSPSSIAPTSKSPVLQAYTFGSLDEYALE